MWIYDVDIDVEKRTNTFGVKRLTKTILYCRLVMKGKFKSDASDLPTQQRNTQRSTQHRDQTNSNQTMAIPYLVFYCSDWIEKWLEMFLLASNEM